MAGFANSVSGTNRVFPSPAMPDDDPIPWLTDLWRSGHCFDVDSAVALSRLAAAVQQQGLAALSGSNAFRAEALTISSILGAVQSTVSGLHADDSIYRVTFDKGATAGTDFHGKSVVVGVGPLEDRSLTDGQRAAVLIGAVFHEDGHINDSQQFAAAVDKAFPKGNPLRRIALKVSNIGDDNRIEKNQCDRYGGLIVALDTAMWYFSKRQDASLLAAGYTVPVPVTVADEEDRERAFLLGIRYPWTGDWNASPAAQAALDRLLSLRDRFTNCTTPSEHVELVREAIDWIDPDPAAEQQPPTTTCPPLGPKGTDGEDGDDTDETGPGPKGTDKGNDEGGNQSSDSSDDGDGDGNDGDDSGESSDDGDGNDGDDSGESSDEDGKQGDESGDSSSDGNPTGAGGTKGRMPDLDAECPARQGLGEHQDIASTSHAEHEKGKRIMGRMRTYGGQLVRERKITDRPVGPVVDDDDIDDMTFFAAESGDPVDHTNMNAVRAVSTNDIPRSIPTAQAKAWAKSRGASPNQQRSAALASSMNSARKGSGAPERYCRSGKIDRGRLARVASGDYRVFQRKTAVAPQSVRAFILMDASASMSGRRGEVIRAATDLAGAFEIAPWATGKVYAHTEDQYGPFVVPLWESGQPTDQIADYLSVPMSGTPEGFALAFVCDDLLESLHPSEKGVVIVCADGQPNDVEQVHSVVEYYRKRGLRVVSVSVAAALDEATQRAMYGKDYLPYNQNHTLFARDLAKVVGGSL